MDRIGLAKRAQIFLKYGGADPVGQRVRELASAKPQQSAFQKILGAVLDNGFRKRRRLNQEKPVITNRGELLRDVLIQQIRRHDILHGDVSESEALAVLYW